MMNPYKNNFAWPKSLDTQWFNWKNPETGDLERIWIPSLTYAFLTMLEIPLRMMQTSMLDSGEGDEMKYDFSLRKWVENDHPCARWWINDPNAKRVKRGVLQKMGTPLKSVSSLKEGSVADKEFYIDNMGQTVNYQSQGINIVGTLYQPETGDPWPGILLLIIK